MYNLFLWAGEEWELLGEFHRRDMMEYYKRRWEALGWTMEYTAW